MRRMTQGALWAVFILAAGCGRPAGSSSVEDIYTEDQGDVDAGSSRRHPATVDEIVWTISMSGCTGHLIGPQHMMTANHCSPRVGDRYRSGAALQGGGGYDIKVTRVTEKHENLDYAILEIEWTGGYPKKQRFPARVPVQASEVTASFDAGKGDEIFTIGFPADKGRWGATFSTGRLLGTEEDHLYYNMGIINGNSGGGVWRGRDNMLVSLTNNGPRAYQQPGWDQADVNSRKLKDHNHGTAMWMIYRQSAKLKELFPGGKNKFYDEYAPGWRRPPGIVDTCYCAKNASLACGVSRGGQLISTTAPAAGGRCDGEFCRKKFRPVIHKQCAGRMDPEEISLAM